MPRKNQLVFIGRNLDEEAITAGFDRCSLTQKPQGVLRDGWTADAGLRISMRLGRRRQVLLVGDASSTLSCLDGKSGGLLWLRDVHGGGQNTSCASNGNPSVLRVRWRGVFWSVADGDKLRAIKVSKSWVEHLSWSPEGSLLAVACSRTALALIHTEAKMAI